MTRPKALTYDRTARTLHWLVAALLAAQFTTAALLPDIEMDTPADAVISLHFSFGIVIAALMGVRLVYRWLHPVAVAPGNAPAWERSVARATHLLFYAVLIVGPFLGWASASAHSIPVRLFGLVLLPALAPRKAAWALLAGDVHGLAMWVLLGLIGLHATVALYHYFVRRDDVLPRMLTAARRDAATNGS